jgi:hypothetical protein
MPAPDLTADQTGVAPGAHLTVMSLSQGDRWVLAGLLWGLAGFLLWPANIPFINDEPQLLDLVWQHQHAGTLPIIGIMGTYGLPYGPLPAWFYELFLSLLGPKLPAIALAKTLLCTSWTLAAGWAIAGRLHWPRWPLLWLVLSPYLYHYQRAMWDNVFLLPLTMTMILTLIYWQQTQRRRWLWAAVLVGAGMGLTHLLALPVLVLLGIALLIGKLRWLRTHWVTALGGLVLGVAILAPYLWASWAARVPPPDFLRTGDWRDAIYSPLWGALWFSGLGLGHFLPELSTHHAILGPWAPLVLGLTTLSLPVMLYGLWRWLRDCWGARKRFGEWPITGTLAVWWCLQVAFFFIFHAWGQREAMPHYSHTLMPLWFMALWQGAKYAQRVPILRYLPAVAMVALLVWTAAMAGHIQRQGGNRGWNFGSTLTTQWQLAHDLQAWDPASQVSIKIPQYQEWRRTLLTVLRYATPPQVAPNRPRGQLVIDYREPGDAGSGYLQLGAEASSMTPQP